MTREEKAKAYDEAIERARRIKNGEDNWRYSDLTEIIPALEEVLPELAESEDERMLRTIIRGFENWKGNGNVTFNNTKVDDILAYLEKKKEQNLIMANSPQLKEQKPNSTEDMPYITDEHFYEREPADSFKYKLAEYMTRCCTKKEGPYGYEYGISAESILKMAEEELLKRGVVQKPAEWNANDKAFIKDCARILDENGYAASAERLLSMFPVKPAEWSDEDEKKLARVIWYVEKGCSMIFQKSDELVFWLKSLPLNLKKKNEDVAKLCSKEWSDEEKRKLNRIYGILGQAADEKPFGSSKRIIGDKEAVELQDFIKSLRPSWKPSEVCYGPTGDPDPAGVWKPSEEQMNGLAHAINLDVYDAKRYGLDSLYNDLKKLM